MIKRALLLAKVFELSTLKLATVERYFFFPTKAMARYWPSALIAVATVVIRQEPTAEAVVLRGVSFQAIPSKLWMVTLALDAGLT
ncbi:unannotated protein [freshwater metagenome]|uniref:Unannotated protein n=1 Tax=freshwater metagenome TaxID=449393 RepID=A0A6J6F3G1_9ZZZZ